MASSLIDWCVCVCARVHVGAQAQAACTTCFLKYSLLQQASPELLKLLLCNTFLLRPCVPLSFDLHLLLAHIHDFLCRCCF